MWWPHRGEAGTVRDVAGSGREHRNRQDVRANKVIISEEDRRILGIWAADCAERVLPLFDQKAPGDTRPREAIEGIRSYACGQMRKGPLRSPAFAALAAARDITDPTAADQRRCGA